MYGSWWRWGALGLSLSLLGGCLRKDHPPGRYVVDTVTLQGSQKVDASDITDQLATTPSPALLGIPGLEGVVFEYSIFEADQLERDLLRIERYLRARGYYEAKVTAARIERNESEATVKVVIAVHEGEPVRVREVVPLGLQDLPAAVGFSAQKAIVLRTGQPFDEADYEASKEGILQSLLDRGYAFAVVKGRANVDIANHQATVRFEVQPGPTARYGPILIDGLDEVPEGLVRSTLKLETGEPYSQADVREAENALVNLGVFASVQIEQDRSRPESRQVELRVHVREAQLRTVRAGIGVQIDPVQLGTTARLGWEDRNLLGGLRDFSIDERPGLSLFPTRTSRLQSPTRVLWSNRLRAQLRQPALFEGRTTGLVTAEYNIYPFLFPLPPDKPADEERILGYHELAGTVGLERSFFDFLLMVAPSFRVQANIPRSYQAPPGEPPLPEGMDTVEVVYPELAFTLDWRDDRINPRRGMILSSSVQSPARWMGSDVTDLRWRPEARGFLPLSKHSVLATRLTFGFLWPKNYGSTLSDATRVAQNPTDPAVIRDQHRLLFRAFYSGGPNSNRGYGFSEVGPHGPLGLLSNGPVNCFNSPDDPDCVRPLGGLTLWEASAEVRFDIVGSFRGVVFMDASDVTRQTGRLRLTVPHLSPGFGFRYDTPIGPLRLDLGYRLLERTRRAPPEGPIRDEAETRGWFGLDWLPMTLHIALGEAF